MTFLVYLSLDLDAPTLEDAWERIDPVTRAVAELPNVANCEVYDITEAAVQP